MSAASFFDMSEKCKQNAQKVGHRVVLAPALSHSSQLGYFRMDYGAKQSISGGGGGLKLMSTGAQHLIPATDVSCKCSLILWIFSLKCASF